MDEGSITMDERGKFSGAFWTKFVHVIYYVTTDIGIRYNG
jgi:hypothetical protein